MEGMENCHPVCLALKLKIGFLFLVIREKNPLTSASSKRDFFPLFLAVSLYSHERGSFGDLPILEGFRANSKA